MTAIILTIVAFAIGNLIAKHFRLCNAAVVMAKGVWNRRVSIKRISYGLTCLVLAGVVAVPYFTLGILYVAYCKVVRGE